VTGDDRRSRTEAALRAAMARLLTGQPIHTDGTLYAMTLAAEAGISRQDLYRTYRPVLDEFREHLTRLAASGAPTDRRAAEIERLKAKLAEATGRGARYRQERDEARRERDANASKLAYFAQQNGQLRQHFEAAAGVSPLRPGGVSLE